MQLDPALASVPFTPRRHIELYEKAKEMEAAFLSEMLGHAGVGKSTPAFGGGVGEEQFASFLRNAQARSIVEKGGLGLAQTIFASLMKAEEGHHDR